MKDKPEALHPTCASCDVRFSRRICITAGGTAGKGCPTVLQEEAFSEATCEYENPDVREFARLASVQEGEGYANRDQKPYVLQPNKTRMEEICEFAHKMGYHRLGMVFCVGLAREATRVEEILADNGFEVVSVICKAGRVDKTDIGVKDDEKIMIGRHESMCNPIFQAKVLNHEKTELNVLLGLCVGHDSLFLKYAEAPCTVLAVKDRVTGHNPLAAIYTSDLYYRKLRHPELLNRR